MPVAMGAEGWAGIPDSVPAEGDGADGDAAIPDWVSAEGDGDDGEAAGTVLVAAPPAWSADGDCAYTVVAAARAARVAKRIVDWRWSETSG